VPPLLLLLPLVLVPLLLVPLLLHLSTMNHCPPTEGVAWSRTTQVSRRILERGGEGSKGGRLQGTTATACCTAAS